MEPGRLILLGAAGPARRFEIMASQDDLQQFARLREQTPPVVIPELPKLPPEVVKRFPEMAKWQADMEAWRVKAIIGIRGGPG